MPNSDSMVRPALFAGQWYPEDPAECRRAIEEYAEAARGEGAYRGLVAPHAGWLYSGAAAGCGFATLAQAAASAEVVVVYGSHRSAGGPNTVFRGTAWETPLGPLENATELADELAGGLALEDEPVFPHRPDNGIELQLPFVRHFFPEARLLALGVAAAPIALEIGRWVGRVLAEHEVAAAVVASTDLTHYGPNYGLVDHGTGEAAARWVRDVNDRGYIDRVLAADAVGSLEHAERNASACCPGAVAAAIETLRASGHTPAPELCDHYLSYDVEPHSSFVGYAAILL